MIKRLSKESAPKLRVIKKIEIGTPTEHTGFLTFFSSVHFISSISLTRRDRQLSIIFPSIFLALLINEWLLGYRISATFIEFWVWKPSRYLKTLKVSVVWCVFIFIREKSTSRDETGLRLWTRKANFTDNQTIFNLQLSTFN